METSDQESLLLIFLTYSFGNELFKTFYVKTTFFSVYLIILIEPIRIKYTTGVFKGSDVTPSSTSLQK